MLGVGIVVFGLLAVVLLWIGIHGFRSAAPRWSDVVTIALGFCAAANAVSLMIGSTKTPLWRRRTAAGQTEAERWEAFRRYLTDFPRLQEAPPATLELWERYLVYGIAFGIAERVLQGAHLLMPEALHNQSYALLDHPDRRPRLGPDRPGDRRPLLRLRLGARAAGLVRGGGGFSGGGGGWRRRRRRRRLVRVLRSAGVLAVLSVTTACGGSKALSKAQYVSRLNAMCQDFRKREQAIGNPQDLVKNGPRIVDAFEKAIVEKVHELKAPREIADQAKRLTAIADEQRNVLSGMVEAAKRGDQAKVGELASKNATLNQESGSIAREIGATACA